MIKHIAVNPEIDNHFTFELSNPGIDVNEYECVIQNSSSEIILNKITPNLYWDFLPETHDTYMAQVFVRDTLVVMKRFKF